MNELEGGPDRAAQRAQVEAALADYPHIGDDRLAALIRWFRKEASALDVGMIASNDAIAEPYRKFRADHIDPLTGTDMVKGLLLAGLAAVAVFLMIWWIV
jgi:hypothetical protein